MAALVRSRRDDDPAARVGRLEAVLRERTAEIARVQSVVSAFRITYKQQVGFLHEQLDDLEAAIEEAECGEIAKRPGGRLPPPAASAPPAQPAAPKYTSDGVRRLFRDVAKAIHPDLARDEETRDRRHALMVEANRAYALGDENRLRRILQTWEGSPEAVEGDDEEAARWRLMRRIAELETALEACAGDLRALKESPLWRLKVMVDEATAKGKDLVGEMVERLKRDIMVAQNRLDAIRPQP